MTVPLDTIRRTYTAAADHFDDLPFWHHFGRRTVAHLQLSPGARVLDLCCGTGASALPAGEAVGPAGSVLGVDLTPALIERARATAAARGLGQVRFDLGDIAALRYPEATFDAILSVFGLFFLDDMSGQLARAWTWLSPGGRLATTVWGATVLSPGEGYFWDAVRKEDATLEHISPAAAVNTPEALVRLHVEAGLPVPHVAVETWRMPLASAEAFWPVIMGTSNRGVFEALASDAQARVKRTTLTRLRDERANGLDNEALVALVTRR